MRILMFVEHFFPPDIRVEKEARTLIEAGHKIFLLCPNRVNEPGNEEIDDINVIRIHTYSASLRYRLNIYWFKCFFINPFWRKQLTHIVERERIDALHIHDLPMVKTGLSVARRFGIPLVADLHENYPAAIQVWRRNRNWRGRLVNRYEFPCWKRFERYYVRRADRIIAVVDEGKEHYVKDCGVTPEKITVVMNTEDLEQFCSIPVKNEIVEKYTPYLTISYIGGFGFHRGVQTAISAMPRILHEIPNTVLLLVGSGSNIMDLKTLAKVSGVEKAVDFTGWKPFSFVPSYIAASKICLVPHIASEHTNTTIPHKLFQYMAMEKPVIVSSAIPLERIVRETGAGLVYPSGDAAALAKAVINLYQNGDLAARLGKAGQRAVIEKYNWVKEGEKLVSLYKGLKDERRG